MAKKGTQVQLQVEVTNDDDWAKLLEREGLIFVDVFAEWCGPCSSMSANLKKIKLEVGGDHLHLAMAKCNNITDLARFSEKSEPTWMFISEGKLVNLMFGVNSPKLQALILDELKKEQAVREGTLQREGVPITTLSPAEQAEIDMIEEKKQRRIEKEKAAKIKAKEERLEVITEAVAQIPQRDFGIFLVFPYALDRLDQIKDVVWDQYKQSNSEKIVLKNINLEDLLHYSEYKFTPEMIEQSENEKCIAYLVRNEDPDINIDDELAQLIYGDDRQPPGAPDSLADHLATPYTPPDRPEESPPPPPPPPDESEPELLEGLEGEAEEPPEPEAPPEKKEIRLDGIWVPSNVKTRHMAMFMFFPNMAGAHVPPEPEPTPPHIAMVFDTWKQNDVLCAVEDNQSEVMHLGFFTDEDPNVATLICKTPAAYARRPADVANLVDTLGDKLVLQLSKNRKEVVDSFIKLGPTYMSPDTVLGAEECKKFFPDGYDCKDGDETTKKVKSKSSKKKKKAVQPTSDETAISVTEDGEVDSAVAGEDGEMGDEDGGEEGDDVDEEDGGEDEEEGCRDIDKATSPICPSSID